MVKRREEERASGWRSPSWERICLIASKGGWVWGGGEVWSKFSLERWGTFLYMSVVLLPPGEEYECGVFLFLRILQIYMYFYLIQLIMG